MFSKNVLDGAKKLPFTFTKSAMPGDLKSWVLVTAGLDQPFASLNLPLPVF